MRGASRASQRFSRVLVLDKAIDALAELHEEEEEEGFAGGGRGGSDDEDAKTRLPPTDRGSNAMLFMLAAFIIEAVMWGFPLTSGGVFTSFYSTQPQFRDNRYLAVIGTLGTGIPFLGAPIITPLTAKWHRYQRHMIWTGWIICILSLVAASFSTKVWHLILTQGLMYGIGFLILYYAVLSMLNEWFVERRGLAYGILFAAAGLSGTGLPFLTEFLLERFGYSNTLRMFACAMLVIVGPTLPFCRGRLPAVDVRKGFTSLEWRSTLSNPLFYFFSVSNLFQGLSYYLPFFYIVLYAGSLSITPTKAILLFGILNLSQVVGQIVIGWLSDCADIFLLLVASNLGSLAACALWVTATGFNHLIIFSVLYGLFAGGYSVLVTRFVSALTGDAHTGLWLYGLLAFQRGVGNVASGPLSAFLLMSIDSQNKGNTVVGFRNLIYFVGACLLAASVGGLGFVWRHRAISPAMSSKAMKLKQRDRT